MSFDRVQERAAELRVEREARDRAVQRRNGTLEYLRTEFSDEVTKLLREATAAEVEFIHREQEDAEHRTQVSIRFYKRAFGNVIVKEIARVTITRPAGQWEADEFDGEAARYELLIGDPSYRAALPAVETVLTTSLHTAARMTVEVIIEALALAVAAKCQLLSLEAGRSSQPKLVEAYMLQEALPIE